MTIYYGDSPIKSMTLTQSWGINPATAELVCVGEVAPVLDESIALSLGGTTWYGRVKGSQAKTGADGVTTSIRLVDNRDVLMRSCIYGQFNMVDEEGEIYHILPGAAWARQEKQYIFSTTGIAPLFVLSYVLSGTGLDIVAGSDVINSLLSSGSFTIPNLDWNMGKKRGLALLEVLDTLGIHFAMGDTPTSLVLSKKGESVEFLEGNFEEWAEGRERIFTDDRITIVGDPIIYEITDYPLDPDWPEDWNSFVWNNNKLLRYLRDIDSDNPWSVTMEDWCTVYEGSYYDERTFAGYDRMDMLVGDYIEQIPFKVYALNLDASITLRSINSDLSDLMPIYDRLASDTSAMVKVKSTGYKFDPHSPLQPLSVTEDSSTSGYEVDRANGKIIFHDRKFKDNGGGLLEEVGDQQKAVVGNIIADEPLLTFAVQREFYSATFGAGSRAGSHHVRNLRREYVCSNTGYVNETIDRGAIPAYHFAFYVAAMMLNRSNVLTNGYVKRRGQCGYRLSDKLDRVTVTLDGDGITEIATYNNEEPQLGIPTEREMERRAKAVAPKTDLARANELWDAVSNAVSSSRASTLGGSRGGRGTGGQQTGEMALDVPSMDQGGIITAHNYS